MDAEHRRQTDLRLGQSERMAELFGEEPMFIVLPLSAVKFERASL